MRRPFFCDVCLRLLRARRVLRVVILVASLRLHFLNLRLHLRYGGPSELPCHAFVRKGDELGWFEHGSTIIVFAPPGFALAPGVEPGVRLRMGQALMSLPA